MIGYVRRRLAIEMIRAVDEIEVRIELAIIPHFRAVASTSFRVRTAWQGRYDNAVWHSIWAGSEVAQLH